MEFQVWWYFSFGDISVPVTFQLWWHFSFGDILVFGHFSFGDISSVSCILSIFYILLFTVYCLLSKIYCLLATIYWLALSWSYFDCFFFPSLKHRLLILTSLVKAYNRINEQHLKYRASPYFGWICWKWEIWRSSINTTYIFFKSLYRC